MRYDMLSTVLWSTKIEDLEAKMDNLARSTDVGVI